MYNYQTFLKESKLKRQYDKIQKQHSLAQQSRLKKNPSLIRAYKKRLEAYSLTLAESFIHMEKFKHRKYEPRPYDSTKHLGGGIFTINYDSSERRLVQSLEKNKILDEIPFTNSNMHVFRETKHNEKPFKYTCFHSTMRVKQHVDRTTQNYLPNTLNPKMDRLAKTVNAWTGQSTKKALIKSLLPSLHQRHYFNSMPSQSTPKLPLASKSHLNKENISTEHNADNERNQEFLKRQPTKAMGVSI